MDSLQHVMSFLEYSVYSATKEGKIVSSPVRKIKLLVFFLKKTPHNGFFFCCCCAFSLDRFGTISPVRAGKTQAFILCRSLTLGVIYLQPSCLCAARAWLACTGAAVLWPEPGVQAMKAVEGRNDCVQLASPLCPVHSLISP